MIRPDRGLRVDPECQSGGQPQCAKGDRCANHQNGPRRREESEHPGGDNSYQADGQQNDQKAVINPDDQDGRGAVATAGRVADAGQLHRARRGGAF